MNDEVMGLYDDMTIPGKLETCKDCWYWSERVPGFCYVNPIVVKRLADDKACRHGVEK